MNITKNWYESKTVWYGIISTLAGVAALIAANPKMGTAALVNGIFVIVLRSLTMVPIVVTSDPIVPTAQPV